MRRSLGHLACLTIAGRLLIACGSSPGSTVIPAHQLAATVVTGGTTTHGVLSFPQHDGAAMHHPGDSTCSWNSGNCGYDEPTYATISGNAPIDSASLTTIGGTFLTYSVTINQPGYADATCIVNESLGMPVPCDYGRNGLTLTLAPE